MIELLMNPWPWYVAGPMIALVMFLLLYAGESFGVSSTLRTGCSALGASRFSDFFDLPWKEHSWNLIFVLGAFIGGAIGSQLLSSGAAVNLHPDVVADMQHWGLTNIGQEYLPGQLFDLGSISDNPLLLLFLLGGGFLVGFGTRYAGGCTSGHAISGLSNLQLPSLVAVIGFFAGGLTMTWLLLPSILQFLLN